MPKLINITGPIAAGKSTVCGLLRKELRSFAFVDRAYLKDMLKPAGKPDAKKIANDATIFIIKELMKKRKNILVQEQSIGRLKSKLRRYSKNYKFYSFFLSCGLEKTIKRDIKRAKESGNPEHIERIHRKVQPSKDDFVIDTEKCSAKETLMLILKNLG
jgi:adenylylsulfate kinase-like enzyme